jgi:predicted TIM-barrel fold metal-dependent hydrolase
VIVDADLWAYQATTAELAPFMSRAWNEYLSDASITSAGTPNAGMGRGMFTAPGAAVRAAVGADDPAALAVGHLDRHGIDRAVLNLGVADPLSGVAGAALSAELARCANDWLVADWLEVDARLAGSISVTLRDVRLAVAEVERVARHEQLVQILIAYPPAMLGDRSLFPLYEVAASHGLPVSLQFGGAYAGSNKGYVPVGFPTSVFEAEAATTYLAQPHLVSLICNGAFDRFPELRVVFSGFGLAWLPSLLWRLDDDFRSGRLPRPRRLARLPSEYLADHVRFTTGDLERPLRAADLVAVLSLVGADRLLLYSSGRGRGDGELEPTLVDALPPEQREATFAGNALRLYRPASARSSILRSTGRHTDGSSVEAGRSERG